MAWNNAFYFGACYFNVMTQNNAFYFGCNGCYYAICLLCIDLYDLCHLFYEC